MRYLLLVVTPREDDQEVWIPYWFEASSHQQAYEQAKKIAFSSYEESKLPLEKFRFELFKTDSILPTTYSSTWMEEFLSKKA